MDDSLSELGRNQEDIHFQKRERELLDKLRQAGKDEELALAFGRCGVRDAALVAELRAAGFEPGNLSLLYLLPLVEVAWADGAVNASERAPIGEAARYYGIAPGDAAHQTLFQWLDKPPAESVRRAALRALAHILQSRDPDDAAALKQDLIDRCQAVAAAAGGFLGFGARVSPEELHILEEITKGLN